MGRASKSEQVERINAVLAWLDQGETPGEVVGRLSERFGISKRQASRYVQQAQVQGQPMAIPEPKRAFTVKLSQTLIRRLRVHARSSGGSLSEIVARALEAFLSKR